MTVASYTLSGLADEVIANNFSDAKYRPSVKTWLNEGQRYIASCVDLRSQFTAMTFATADFANALPDDFSHLVDVNLATDGLDWTPLSPIELREFDDASVTYGTPTSYVVAGNVLYLYPYPASSVTIEINYERLPADMNDDDDTPEIPAAYQHLLIRYALVRCYEREGDFQAANYTRNAFEADVLRMKGEVQHDTWDGPRQVAGSWGTPQDAWR